MTKIEVVQINSNEPIPEKYTKYPFDALEVGDNFSVSISRAMSAATSVSRRNKMGDKKFLARKVDAKTMKIWRIK